MKNVFILLLPLFCFMGCATAPMETARLSSPWAPKPLFKITLHCPEDMDAPVEGSEEWMLEQESLAAEPETFEETDYACYSLLETMQAGAMVLLPQARYEPRR